MQNTPVFVWRGSTETTTQGPYCRHCKFYIESVSVLQKSKKDEPFCLSCQEMARTHWDDPYWTELIFTTPNDIPVWEPYELTCPRCGWWSKGITNWNGEQFDRLIESVLRDLDINSSELLIDELCSHISGRFSDLYSLSPRRFEELVGNVYSNLGWKIEMTKQTRDGGIDLFCLKRGSSETCIVECKRFAKHRKVGISAIDRLVGAAFRTGTYSAHLVTSSSFTSIAKKARRQAFEQGLDLELIDGYELLKMVDTFADPRLSIKDVELIYSDDN